MANGFASGGATAPYPSNGFPGIAFFGAGQPGRSGFSAGKASGGPSSGGGPGRAGSAVNGILPASVTQHHVIALLVFVGVAYGLWHVSSRL